MTGTRTPPDVVAFMHRYSVDLRTAWLMWEAANGGDVRIAGQPPPRTSPPGFPDPLAVPQSDK